MEGWRTSKKLWNRKRIHFRRRYQRLEFLHHKNDGRYDQAKQDHGRNGEIESEVFSFNTDITGQPSDPMQA